MTFSDSIFEAAQEILRAVSYYRTWNSPYNRANTVQALAYLYKILGDCDCPGLPGFENQTPLDAYTQKAAEDFDAAANGTYFSGSDERNECI